MVNVHARYIDVLETEGWLDRGLEFLPTDKQIAERQAVGRRAAGTGARRADRLHEERQRGRDRAHRPARRRPAGGRPASATSRPALRERYADAIRQHPLRREIIATAARQPDGQPVGHLVRPPHDRGHRRLRGRRHPGLARGPRGARLRRSCGPRSTRSPGSVPLDIQLDLFLDCRRMAERGVAVAAAPPPPADRRRRRRRPVQARARRAGPRRWSRCSSAGWPTSCARSRRRG